MVVHNWEVAPKTNDYYTFCCRTSPEDIWEKDEQIRNLEKNQDNIQAQANWAEGDCLMARHNEKGAFYILRGLTSLINQLADSVNKATLYNA